MKASGTDYVPAAVLLYKFALSSIHFGPSTQILIKGKVQDVKFDGKINIPSVHVCEQAHNQRQMYTH
jgi:hypothetical protein